MGLKIGVVCEGSHDFTIIRRFAGQILADQGLDLDAIDCLQPQVSATFQQTNGGGWGRVKGWCEANQGKHYRIYFDQPLFSQSPIYDILIIHLDGDVIDICNASPLAGLSSNGMSSADICTALEDAILKSWISCRPEDVNRFVTCIPVRHFEAWLLAALDPTPGSLEQIDTKDVFRKKFEPQYSNNKKNLYGMAANDAASSLNSIKSRCISYDIFEKRIITSSVKILAS